MNRKPDAELLWLISFIKDLCGEATKDHPSNAMKYIDKINTYCNIANDKFQLTKDGKQVELK